MNSSFSFLLKKVIGTVPPVVFFAISSLFLLIHLSLELADAQNTYRLNKAPHYKSFEKYKGGVHHHYRFDKVLLHPVMKSEFAYLNREGNMQPIANTLSAYINSLAWIASSKNHSGLPNKGLFKKKVVLGTGYEREIRFLSAIDKPVAVLQLTGVLLDHKGNVVRAGSEAFFHEDTPFWAQVLDMSKIIDNKSLERAVLSERRDDLPGNPPTGLANGP